MPKSAKNKIKRKGIFSQAQRFNYRKNDEKTVGPGSYDLNRKTKSFNIIYQ